MRPTQAIFAQAPRPRAKTKAEEDAYERGRAVGEAAGPCCCVGFMLVVVVLAVGIGLIIGMGGKSRRRRRRPRRREDD